MPRPENRKNPIGVASAVARPKRGLLEVLIFSFGCYNLVTVVPLCLVGLIAVLVQFALAAGKDLPMTLPTAIARSLFLIKDGGVWTTGGIVLYLLLALGSIIYLNCYFPQYEQRPWQRRLTTIVLACGGGAAAFKITLNLWVLLKMPGNDEQNLYNLEAVIAAFIVGFFCALLAAYWPAWRKGRCSVGMND